MLKIKVLHKTLALNDLQKSLLINAGFSGISAFVLIAFNKEMAELFGITNSNTFRFIGVLLIFFAVTILYMLFKQRPIGVLWFIIQDYILVLGGLFMIVLNPFEISIPGNIIIGFVAIIVLLMGIKQSKALAKVDTIDHKNLKRLRFERLVNTNKLSAWKVITDFANFDKYAPNIDHVKIIFGEGLGMVRTCSNGTESWGEICTMWEEENAYSFEIDTSATFYPYPFKFLKSTWELDELVKNDLTKIIMFFDFKYKHKYQEWLFHPFYKFRYSKIFEELLDNWKNHLEN